MAIVLLIRPYTRNWSGNPIHYVLYSAAAEADPTNFFEIRVQFKRTDAAVFTDVITLPYKPVTGAAKIDIQDILDGLLEYELPYLPNSAEFASPYFSNKMTGKFYLEWREITTLDPDPDWVDTEDANQLFVIKGGLSFHKWRGDNFWVNYFDTAKPFLGWEKNGSLHSLSERMYLAWLNLTDINEGDIKMKRTVRFTDGTDDIAYLNCPVSKYNVCYFPSGGGQLEIETIDNTKTIYYWELQVVKITTNPYEPLSEVYRYYADNRKDYNGVTLNYRNSLGGIGSARVRGVIDFTLNRNFTETERIVQHNYFSEHFFHGRIRAENSWEILVYKGDLGYLGKDEQDRLRDIHFRRECWWEQQKKWLPVMLLTAANRLKLSTDNLFPMPIEFCIAAGEEFYYTPESVNLAEAAPAVGLVCNAIINNLDYSFGAGGWTVTWDLVSGAPVKYHVSTPAVSGGAPGESINTSYTIPWLPVGDNVITVKPLCFIGGQFYFGAAQQITITVEPACVNVGINDSPVFLPDALETVPYNFVMNLTGTAPFVLSNIVKPAWMSITVVGSTIEFTGTPGGGSAGTDIDVSFDIGNCAGAGTVNYADTIDVLVGAGNGDLYIINDAAGANFIKNVSAGGSPFFTITTGSIPVMAGEQAIGFLTQAVNVQITFKVVVSVPTYSMELWKNGALQESILISSTGTYSFAVVNFLISDNMEIKLVP